MRIEETNIPEVKVIHLDSHSDGRGLFAETYDKRAFARLGVETEFVLDAFSLSIEKGTVRGLHFQIPPHDQAKLVRAGRGRLFDVAVDLRKGSPSFGRHVSFVLEAGDWRQVLIPASFAHGFCTLEDDTEIVYKMSDQYAPESCAGILWNDPDLGIDWPVTEPEAILTDKDKTWPRLAELAGGFND